MRSNQHHRRRRRPRSQPLLPPPSYRIFVFGSGAGSALGADEDGRPRRISLRPVPLMVPSSKDIETVAAGDRVSSFLTREGDCYSWGKMGRDTECPEPSRIIDKAMAIRTIRHGSAHAVALTAAGRALFWSSGSSRSRVTPRPIPPMPAATAGAATGFQDVGCCDRRALLLSQDGRSVYEYAFPSASGAAVAAHVSPAAIHRRARNAKQQQQQSSSPLRLVPFPAPVQIANLDCGPNHTALVSTAGHLYTYGWGQYGRLGLGDEESRSSPQLVETLARDGVPIANVSCGSAHSVALSTSQVEGRVYAFGSNAYGQVGSAAFDRYLHPHEILIDGRQVSSVACGFGHTAAVTCDGALYCWGFNEEGQLGLGTEGRNVDVPTRVDEFPHDRPAVVKVACGHLHTVCVASNLSPAAIEEYGCQMKRLEKAGATIRRFARFSLLRIRLRQNIMSQNSDAEEHETNGECDEPDNSSESESSNSISSDGFMIRDDDTSTGSSASDAENVPDVNAADEAIRRHQEMTAMEMEDYACHEIRQGEMTRAEELRRQEELKLMMAEDHASHLVRSAEQRVLAEARQNRAHQKVADRNARVAASIQREANRLKQARERQREQESAKMKLPQVSRRRRIAGGTDAISSKISTQKQKNFGNTGSRRNNRLPKTKVEVAQSLLENRRIRLKEQNRIERERQRQRDQEAESLQRAEKQRQLSAKRETERLEKERKKRVDRNLEELKGKLGLLVGPSANAIQNSGGRGSTDSRQRVKFKTTEQWTRQLKRR